MEIIQLIIGLASIVSVVAGIWALRKVMQIYGITVDSSGLDKWESAIPADLKMTV